MTTTTATTTTTGPTKHPVFRVLLTTMRRWGAITHFTDFYTFPSLVLFVCSF